MNIYIVIITIIAIIFNLFILIFPEDIMLSAGKGLVMWYKYALPALFPFMVGINFIKNTPFPLMLSKILSPITYRIFGIKGYGTFAMISGLLSGYPVGAKTLCDLYNENKLTKGEASYLISFCNNSGPLFMLGTVGAGFLHSKSTGILLLTIHYLSALAVALIMPRPHVHMEKKIPFSYVPLRENLEQSLISGINAIVMVGGYIVLFSIISTVLENIASLIGVEFSESAAALFYGILEITNGCSRIRHVTPFTLSIISGIIAFGGLSIQSQSMSYISKTDISCGRYLLTKALQGIIAFCLCTVLSVLLPI